MSYGLAMAVGQIISFGAGMAVWDAVVGKRWWVVAAAVAAGSFGSSAWFYFVVEHTP